METQTLIDFKSKPGCSSEKDDYSRVEAGSLQTESWRMDYGSCRPHCSLPPKSQLVFKWCDINAYGEQKNPSEQMTFSRYLSRRSKIKKHILKNVNGVAYPGELLVLMGSSGAGKTTLLNCMTFRNVKSLDITGQICINNEPVTQSQLAAHSAYIQQDDMFIGWLTVREHLIFQALVRMDTSYTYEERVHRVDNVIGELSLKKCRDTQIGYPGVTKGISGGERKRLALAAELLTDPSLLFCDEPTSGLDSFMSLNVVQMLKTMAKTGRTVICTLHQPSSELFQMFDKICFLAEGRVAFLGDSTEANSFFERVRAPCPVNFNPADYYIQLLSIIPGREESCRQAVKTICDSFETSEFGQRILRETSLPQATVFENIWLITKHQVSPYKASWFCQFRAVSWRCWLSITRNPRLTKVRFLQVLFVTALLSLLFWQQKYDQFGVQNINGVLFLFLTNATFQNLIGVIATFCGELPLFLREHKNGMYRSDVYFLSKMLADIPSFTILNVLMTSICYICIGLNPQWPKVLNAVGIMLLVVYTVMSAGYFISTVAPNIATANSMVTMVVTPFLIFGGFFLSMRSIPSYLTWLADFSWFKYGNSALLINQWTNVTNIICNNNTSACLNNGEVVLESLGVNGGDFLQSILCLIALTVLLRVVSFMVLLYKAYHFE
ncbi:protein white-like isoform X3 [Coccinella septempunctata]|uniref:protein white-like isoform X3 n=1 Tax=Coccinella septempunctata TaxID=41139 RepID=UPI001D087735|nr:protein white-like isoform X3 [Coccinella septempunctata]